MVSVKLAESVEVDRIRAYELRRVLTLRMLASTSLPCCQPVISQVRIDEPFGIYVWICRHD